MQSMPRSAVLFAALAIGLAAGVGLYLGASRSLASPGIGLDEAGTIVAPVTPVASAKPMLTPTETLGEADVRRMAREEAQAILARSAPKKAVAKADDEDDDAAKSEQLTPVAPASPVAAPAAAAAAAPG